MRLLVISHTAHYLRGGQHVGWGPTVKELDWLGKAFDELVHLATFHEGQAPESALPYESANVRLVLVPPAGGLTLSKKLRVLTVGPRYTAAVLAQIRAADAIQVRTPGSLGLYGMVLVSLNKSKPRWVKYAGNWMEKGFLPLSFSFQRVWLKLGLSGGPVTVNGRWPAQPKYIYSFFNPSLTRKEVLAARHRASAKTLSTPVRIVFAGRLERAKGIHETLAIFEQIAGLMDAHLDVFGDGPEMERVRGKIAAVQLENRVTFHGWAPHSKVKAALAEAHFLLLPTASEGWPKVLSEAMAYGVVPVTSQVSSIPQILHQAGTGFAIDPSDLEGFVGAVLETIQDPRRWASMREAGLAMALNFTYERYLMALNQMFLSYYGSSPMKQEVIAQIQAECNGSMP